MVFKLLINRFITETYSDNTVKTFKGLRVLAIDGSTVRLPASKELYEIYGNNNLPITGIPLAQTSVMFDVLNGLTLHASINPYNTGERKLAVEHINELEKQDQSLTGKTFDNDVMLFDRGYPSLPLMFFLQSKNKHFLMRMQRLCLSEVREVVEKGLVDTEITISAFKKGREKKWFL